MLRSVKYDPYCNCQSQAGIPAWAIAVSILIVLLVAVTIFLVYRYFHYYNKTSFLPWQSSAGISIIDYVANRNVTSTLPAQEKEVEW